jgi:hypothetical protein
MQKNSPIFTVQTAELKSLSHKNSNFAKWQKATSLLSHLTPFHVVHVGFEEVRIPKKKQLRFSVQNF